MSKVLVTGACGFIGRYVAQTFAAEGHCVTGMGWGKFPDHAEWGISSWYECDVNIETLCAFANKPDVIVHCAGGSAVAFSVDHPRQDFCLTVDTTSYVLEYIRMYNPQASLVYPSTAAVYGETTVVPISERTLLAPVSPYGVHKLMAESLCQMYADRYNISVAIVRLFSIYGEGLRKQLLWDACNKLSVEDVSFFGTGCEVRDWLHVNDAASLLMMAADHTSNKCLVVNGGSGEGTAVREVLIELFSAFGRNDTPQFSGAARTGDPSKYIADIECVRTWGWKHQVSWRDGMCKYVQWYRKENS